MALAKNPKGPMVNAMCEKCDWSCNTHTTDVRKWGIQIMVHMDQNEGHTVVCGIAVGIDN